MILLMLILFQGWPMVIHGKMWMMMGSDIYHSRRSPPRTIGQMRTIKNLPPDSELCAEIPTVIKSTAGFRHRTVGFWRLPSLVGDGEIILYTLGSNNWWCGHVYLAEEDLPCPGPPVRCRNINLWPGRSPCGNHQGIKQDFMSWIALMTGNMSH